MMNDSNINILKENLIESNLIILDSEITGECHVTSLTRYDEKGLIFIPHYIKLNKTEHMMK